MGNYLAMITECLWTSLVPHKRGSREITSLSTMWGHSEKGPVRTRKRTLMRMWSCCCLDLGFPSSRTKRDKFLLVISSPNKNNRLCIPLLSLCQQIAPSFFWKIASLGPSTHMPKISYSRVEAISFYGAHTYKAQSTQHLSHFQST